MWAARVLIPFPPIYRKMAVQSDGKILIGGDFTTYNGNTTVNHIARLNTDGTLDMTFTTGTGASSRVNTIVLQPDGKILIGGTFTRYRGAVVNRIVRPQYRWYA